MAKTTESTKRQNGAKEPQLERASTWRKLKKPLLVLLFVAVNIIVIVATAVAEFGNSKTAAELKDVKINGWLLIPAALCFLVALGLDIYKYALMIRQNSVPGSLNRHEIWKIARRTVILGRYYDNITPAAVGGQPFQIYYLHKNGKLTSGLATTVSMMGMISLQIAFIIIALICFLSGGLGDGSGVLSVTAWLGLLFYAFWPVTVILAMFFPKITAKLINFVVIVLAKLKIVKNRQAATAKIEHEVNEYASSIKVALKSKRLVVQMLLASLVFNFLTATVPFFVLTAFGGGVDFWQTFATTIAVMSAVYFVPTPGNSGAAEGTFFLVFSALSDGYVFWAMLVWRFFSYYIYIIMGLITYFIMNLAKRQELISKNHSAG